MKEFCAHQPFEINNVNVYGGSIFAPVRNMSHYFYLDGSVKVNKPYITLHHIQNYGVPTDKKHFYKCLLKAKLFIDQELLIFVGCISGHGRSGLFITMLNYLITKDVYSLYQVRERYCHRAVESVTQLQFLEDRGLRVYKEDYERVLQRYTSQKKVYQINKYGGKLWQ